MEIAYLWAKVAFDKIEIDNVSFFFDGPTNLKGVLGGARYPVFWIDSMDSDALNEMEDKLLNKTSCNAEYMLRYATAFFDKYSKYLYKPFIISDSDPSICRQPEGYAKHLERWEETWVKEKEKLELEAESVVSNDPPLKAEEHDPSENDEEFFRSFTG